MDTRITGYLQKHLKRQKEVRHHNIDGNFWNRNRGGTMFSGFAYTVLIAGIYFLTKAGHWGFSVYIGVFTGVTLIVCMLLYRWLKQEGSKRFANL